MVPDGWKNTHLVELIEGQIKNGYSPNATDYITGYWVLGLGALGEDGFNHKEIKPVEPTEKVRSNLLACNDFLVSRSNTPDKVGRAVRYKGELSNCSYPDLMMRFRIDPKKADLDYVEQKIRSSSIRSYYKSRAAGSSSTMVKINKSVVEKTPIQLPPLSEQKKIAKILSTWDRAIEVTEKQISNSQQQKKSLMQQLLTGKKRLPRFSGEWLKYQLKQLCNITKGKQLNRNTLSKKASYPVINGGITPSGYTEKFNREENTVTISEGGNSCGYVSLINTKFWCGGHCYSMNNPTIPNSFLYQILKFYEPKIMRLRVGSGLPNIQKKGIDVFKILMPEDKEEQQKIASVLSTADKEIETLQQKLECLRQEKKALMQQLLTGKRRVKIDENDIPRKEVVRA